MSIISKDSLGCLDTISTKSGNYKFFNIKKAADKVGFDLKKLPYSLRVLFENALRGEDGADVTPATFEAFKGWLIDKKSDAEVAFRPARVLMQDFTGVPAVVDLAAMRDAMKALKGDPNKINPLIPVDLVIDHSVQVDNYASSSSLQQNIAIEMERNQERYEFLKWGQETFDNFKVVPPGTGICHQVNIEYLAQVVWTNEVKGQKYVYPDTLVGTDSHTTMVNALAVLGWGVGGIEAEAAMLGQALPMILPEVVGFKLYGKPQEGITATDIVLTAVQMLRKLGVVGKFVEFYGPGLNNMSLADRATIANMAPEYGATCGFFPVDDETLNYLRLTARDDAQIALVKEYCQAQGMLRDDAHEPVYSAYLELDLGSVEPSLAGPKRPQDRVSLAHLAQEFQKELPSLMVGDSKSNAEFAVKGQDYKLTHGSVTIAAITSCTNTSNPSVMLAAGLVAKKAHELGITRKKWVKTSLAPGSQVVSEYLKASGLDKHLDAIGFNTVGYGCTTCIGNSGPLEKEIEEAISENKIVVASVLSGNRNFEGRVHPLVRANYLASPPLVVIYALAGNVNINVTTDPIAKDKNGNDVYLKDLWPSNKEIQDCVNSFINAKMFAEKYADVFSGTRDWKDLPITKSTTYSWDAKSTYINNPPYFVGMGDKAGQIHDIKNAKILAMFADSITTDHISPAGNIAKASPAAKYLLENNVSITDFNSYGSRRGNHEVMMRGTFANIRIKNELCPGTEGGVTKYMPTGEVMSIYDAAMKYQEQNTQLVIFAGKEYGTGSSRDWAAKGTTLLGVKAVIAESFERIHRSNLVGMGVLPLVFKNGENRQSLNIIGDEEISIENLSGLKPYADVICSIKNAKGEVRKVTLTASVFTDNEVEYLKNAGILHKVIRDLKAV